MVRMQWGDWLEVFREVVGEKRIMVRFVVVDFFLLCWMLKRNKECGELEVCWYRREVRFDILVLDEKEYVEGEVLNEFDVVDMGVLGDEKGVLNMFVVGLVLLKRVFLLMIYMECYVKDYEVILEGYMLVFLVLLGVSLGEYWINLMSVVVVDEVLVMFSERYVDDERLRGI